MRIGLSGLSGRPAARCRWPRLRGSCGIGLAVDATIATHRGRLDTLLVAGSPDIEAVEGDARLRTWVRSPITMSDRPMAQTYPR